MTTPKSLTPVKIDFSQGVTKPTNMQMRKGDLELKKIEAARLSDIMVTICCLVQLRVYLWTKVEIRFGIHPAI